ncbi:MAG: hypothetical protein J7L75_00740 [Thermoproteales archaeon]|nr:hypothetical protein [Thermoproteales archaeon]
MYYIVCSRCSFILYSGERPVEVIKVLMKYGDRCPRCLRRLSLEPKRVEVRPRH